MTREERAAAYFASVGIDPSVAPSADTERGIKYAEAEEYERTVCWQRHRGFSQLGVTTLPCVIDILGVVFYSHVEVTFADPHGKTHTFEGDAGGVGVGEIDGPGVIYYSDLDKLLATKTFGVAFVAEDGGTAMVTWGSHGNANIVGIGDGLGGFGGSGKWK